MIVLEWLYKEQGSLTTSVVILWSVRYKHVPNAKIKGVFRKLCCSHGNLQFQKFFHQQRFDAIILALLLWFSINEKQTALRKTIETRAIMALELKVNLNDSYVEWLFYDSMSSVFNHVDLNFVACEMSICLFRLLFHTPLIFVLTSFKQL